MILFFLLLVLLAIAWGLADYQLQSRIEREPPPVSATKSVVVVAPKAEVAPPAEDASGNNPPAGSAEPAPVAGSPVAAQDVPPVPAATERTPE